MVYPVDPANAASPQDIDGATQGAEEFRQLKARVNALAAIVGLGGISAIPFKNKVINGNFSVDQRNEGAVATIATTAVVRTIDRWCATRTGSGEFTVTRESDALFPGQYRCKLEVTVADAAIAATDLYQFAHTIEGYNCIDLSWGTAGAIPIAVSFEIESTVAGLFGLAFRNSIPDRVYRTIITVNQPNVRETKTIIVPGDMIGAWNTQSASGIRIILVLLAGANNLAAPNPTWNSGSQVGTTGITNFMATLGNKIWLKNFQVETGNKATGFEYIPFDVNLARCLRYYEKSFPIGTVPAQNTGVLGSEFSWIAVAAGAVTARSGICTFLVEKRATPAILRYNPGAASNAIYDITGTVSCTSSANDVITSKGLAVSCTSNAGTAIGNRLGFNWSADSEYGTI